MANTVANLLMTDVQTFLQVQSAFDQCDEEIKHVIMDMITIHNDPESSDEEKTRAGWTIVEALFPSVAVDFMQAESTLRNSNGASDDRSQLDEQEQTFAEKLAAVMKAKNVTQELLAEKTGVGQPAICNMLKRACRPQKRTVVRIAEALDVKPEELWPGM